MRNFVAFAVLVASLGSHSPALADEPFPKTGAAKLAAYAVCRSLAIVDMRAAATLLAECTSIVKRPRRREAAGRS